MPMSKPEKQRQYRLRIMSDPERCAAYKAKEKLRWKQTVDQGKVKAIADLTERAGRQKRKHWRDAQRESRNRKRNVSNVLSPPATPTQNPPDSPKANQEAGKVRILLPGISESRYVVSRCI